MNNIGYNFLATGMHSAAEGLFKSSIEIDNLIYGKEENLNITTFSNLALSYSIQGKFDEAVSYFDKAIRKSILTIQKEAQSLMLHKRQRFIESEASNYMMPFAWVLEDPSLKNIALFSRLNHP